MSLTAFSAADMILEMWDAFWEISGFPFLPPPTTSHLFSHDLPTSRKKTTYPRNHYDKRAPSASPSGFYLAPPPPPPLWVTHMCNNRYPELKDLHTWHLLSKRSPLQPQELWHQHNGDGPGSTAYLFWPMFGKMSWKLFSTIVWRLALWLNWLVWYINILQCALSSWLLSDTVWSIMNDFSALFLLNGF